MIRQRVIKHLLDELQFPLGCVTVEKSLKQMPSLGEEKVPLRRTDILCYTPFKETLQPLLLIECKAVKLTSHMINQVIGYNYYLKARFLALVNEQEIRFGWFDSQKKEYTFINFIPLYQDLINLEKSHPQ